MRKGRTCVFVRYVVPRHFVGRLPGLYNISTVLQAYFDNSEGGSGEIAAVGCYLARKYRWARFAKKWDAVLARHDVVPPFHMVEYANFQGQFSRFRDNRDTWDALIVDLLRIIERVPIWAFAQGVRAADCAPAKQFPPPDNDLADPHMVGYLACFHALRLGSQSGSIPKGRITCLVDRDEQRMARVSRMHELYVRLYPDVFDPDLGVVTRQLQPVQAADILAYEMQKRLVHVYVEKQERPIRKSAEVLFLKNVRAQAAYHPPELIRDFMANLVTQQQQGMARDK